MATGIQAIKDRLAALNSKEKKSKQEGRWQPKDEHDVRALPHEFGKDGDPFVELHFHRDIGNNPPILCPKLNFGEDCEICDFCDQLRAWRGPDGNDKPESERKADWELFKKLNADKGEWHIPVVERGQETTGQYSGWFRLNQTNYGELLGACANEEYNELIKESGGEGLDVLFGTKSAFDVHVSYKKKGEKGNTKTFNLTDVALKLRPTPLHKDKAVVEKLLKSVKSIYSVYPKVSSEEVSRIFQKFIGAGGSEAKSEPAPKDEYRPKKNSGENAKTVGSRSIDEAFGDLAAEDESMF